MSPRGFVHMSAGTQTGQISQVVVRHPVWVLGFELRASARAVWALNLESSPRPWFFLFFFFFSYFLNWLMFIVISFKPREHFYSHVLPYILSLSFLIISFSSSPFWSDTCIFKCYLYRSSNSRTRGNPWYLWFWLISITMMVSIHFSWIWHNFIFP